eukprot:TRINITY_DN12156_c0_g2_i1.p1 TRINITY_DN12156_c0_g2~~TRINITY_DN12156_c0_g2_i1.p1  ORF type:complete len:278 (+),score=38.80 TRINITY_DN12156_c0_g2_i1:55-888(+)
MKPIVFVTVSLTSLLVAMLMAGMMADGTSLYRLKNSRLHVGPGLIELRRIPYIDSPYAIGIIMDSYDNKWKDGKRYGRYQYEVEPYADPHPGHFFQLFECTDHQKGGMVVMASSIICVVTACVMFIVNVIGYTSIEKPEKVTLFGRAVIGMQIFLIIFNFMAVAAAAAVYNTSYNCNQFPAGSFGETAVTSVRVVQLFDFAYGCIFMVFLLFLELVMLGITILNGTHHAPEDPFKLAAEEELEQENGSPRAENYAAACFTPHLSVKMSNKGSMNPRR